MMKNLFPGHYKPSQEDFKKLWNKCIFVFDTNILLNVYRYSEKTRERLFEILDLLKERIWLPYQVAYEYQEERLKVISHQLEPYEEIEKVLNENLKKLNSAIEPYRKRHSFTSLVKDKNLIDTIKRANKRIIKSLEEKKAQYPNLIENDVYRDRIDNLFEDKIGTQYDVKKLEEVHKQCESRFEKNIPPGYKDKKKSVEQKQYGDAILWLQIIEYAKNEKKPIIFVTDDTKEDWWKIHQGQTISPRTELIEEIKAEAKVDFWMYTGDRFLMYAEEHLKLNEQPEAVEEAEEIRLEDKNKLVKELSKTLLESHRSYPDVSKRLEEIITPRINMKDLMIAQNVIKSLNNLAEITTPRINMKNINDSSKKLDEYSNDEDE